MADPVSDATDKVSGWASSAWNGVRKVVNSRTIALSMLFATASFAVAPTTAFAAFAKGVVAVDPSGSVLGTAAQVASNSVSYVYHGVSNSGPLFTQLGDGAKAVIDWGKDIDFGSTVETVAKAAEPVIENG